MSHLSPAEFADAADGTLPSARMAHVARCDACRRQIDGLDEALRGTRAVDVPEPSPLYWTHLSARIREQVADERIAPAWRAGSAAGTGWWRDLLNVRGLVPAASAVALAAAVVVSGVMLRHERLPVEPVRDAAVMPLDAAVSIDDSEAWQMLTSAAAETPIEDAHAAGMGVPAGAIDRAVQRMTPDELNALGRLLQDEMHRSGN